MSDQYFIKKEKITALASTAIFKFVENAKIAKSVDSVWCMQRRKRYSKA